MKKKFLIPLLSLCIFTFAFLFAGCGEQFIVERTYKLISLQIIQDNTPLVDGYDHFQPGEFADSLTGNMLCNQCKIEVGTKQSKLIFDDSENSGLIGTYTFSVYTNDDVYPAYTLSAVEIKYNGEIINPETFSVDLDNQDMYNDVVQFSYVLEYGDTSLQLVTQNKSLAAQIIILDKESQELLFMGMLYGY